jgi:hypothetical protein
MNENIFKCLYLSVFQAFEFEKEKKTLNKKENEIVKFS